MTNIDRKCLMENYILTINDTMYSRLSMAQVSLQVSGTIFHLSFSLRILHAGLILEKLQTFCY